MELGRATGIVAFSRFGYDISFEAAHSADRLRIFKSAAHFALTEGRRRPSLRKYSSMTKWKWNLTSAVLGQYEAAVVLLCLLYLGCLVMNG